MARRNVQKTYMMDVELDKRLTGLSAESGVAQSVFVRAAVRALLALDAMKLGELIEKEPS